LLFLGYAAARRRENPTPELKREADFDDAYFGAIAR
jgi:hypothetical protein